MLQISVNNHFSFTIEKHDNQLTINKKLVNADIEAFGNDQFHVLNQLKSYNVEVVKLNRELKAAVIKVNGTIYELKAKDQFDLLLDKMGFNDSGLLPVNDIKAPMPGLVLKLFVGNGMEVKKGENLFILEAMKMENIIKAPADLLIKNIRIKQGDKVEKGQIMIQL